MALPPSSSFSHPRQLVLFFRASILMFSLDRRLSAQIQLNCSLSAWVHFPFREFSFSLCLVSKVVTQGEWLFRCNASYGAADDFSHFVLPSIQMWYVRQELQKRLFSMDRSHSDASKRHSCITVRLARSEAGCMGSR